MSQVGFRVFRGTKAVKEDESGPRNRREALVGRRIRPMKVKITRLLITLSSIGMIAFAGGASLRGF
jgi:hypothetical protein